MLQATGKKLIVSHPDDKVELSKGGIAIPEVAMESYAPTVQCSVISVGPQVEEQFVAEDSVYIRRGMGTSVKINDTKYLIVTEEQIIAKVM